MAKKISSTQRRFSLAKPVAQRTRKVAKKRGTVVVKTSRARKAA